MKILHIIGGGDVGGAKAHVLFLIKELSKYIDVKLISLRPGPFADDARSMGINVEIIKTGNIISDIKRVIKIVKEENYQIIHSHGAKANMISMFAKDFANLPTVTTVHSDYRLDYLHSFSKRLSFGLINTLSLRFLDYYIGVSNNFKEMLVKRKFDPEKIFTVYNGIDFDTPMQEYSRSEFSSKYNLDLKEDDIVVGILARLDPVKGIGTFLQAAKEVLAVNPSVKFIIGGDGKERKSLEHKASALGISDNVLFPGWINDRFEFMSIIDINVLTSLSESFPYVILEGARLKRATVSSNVGGLSDLIETGENGYLFTPGDYKKLAEYLLKLVNDSSLRTQTGERIFKKASEQFSLDNMCKTQLDIYENILKNWVPAQKTGKAYDVIISGYYGFNNIGDDAMLMAIINNLRMLKEDIKILVLSRNPHEAQKIHKVASINRFNLLHVLYLMKNSKLFINGGGNLIQDNTSTRSLMYYLIVIWMAKKMGMKVMIYANGIGPLKDPSNRKYTKNILDKVDVITLREEMSISELKELGITRPRILLTADPALTLDASSDTEINNLFRSEGIDLKGSYVGFSVRKWGKYESYEETIAGIADYMAEKYAVKPVFIPMHYPQDLDITESIVAKMKSKGYIIRNKYSGACIMGIMKRLDMLVGMRLHALIFAASAGVPIVGLEYEKKVQGFLQYIGLASFASAGHVNDLEYNKLKTIIDDVWNKRDAIKKQLLEKTVQLKEKALENAKIAIDLMNER